MKRRNFLKQAMVVGGGALIAAPAFIGMVNRRNGFWQQQDSGLWSLKQADPIFASSIITRNIGGIDDRRISLSNSNFARLLPASLGTWSKVRLAMLLSANASANVLSSPVYTFGLCSGTSNIYMDATTTNYIGVRWTGTEMTYSAPTMPNLSPFSNVYAVKRVGSTTTNSGSTISGASHYLPANAAAANRRMQFIDVIKGSPNYTIKYFFCSALANTDVLPSDFLTQAGTETCSFTDHTLHAGVTLAFDEVAGALNALNVAWSATTGTLEVCEIAIAKFA